MGVYFWTIYCISLIYLFIFLLIPHSLNSVAVILQLVSVLQLCSFSGLFWLFYSELLQALLSGEAERRQQVNSYNTNTTNARGMYDIIKQECLNQPRRKWKVKEAFPKRVES